MPDHVTTKPEQQLKTNSAKNCPNLQTTHLWDREILPLRLRSGMEGACFACLPPLELPASPWMGGPSLAPSPMAVSPGAPGGQEVWTIPKFHWGRNPRS
eukprot:2954531-Amphidinium_carterae.1